MVDALPSVDPRSFGAVGDGTVNDSAAVQAAVSYLEANGGGSVVIARGMRFAIPDGVALLRNAAIPVSIIGQGGALVGGTLTVGPAVPVASGLKGLVQEQVTVLVRPRGPGRCS